MAEETGLQGVYKLVQGLKDLPMRVQRNVLRTTIFRIAQQVRDRAKQILQANGSVQTGNLLRTIRAVRDINQPNIVSSKVLGGSRSGKRSAWYGLLVEKGHLVVRPKVGGEKRLRSRSVRTKQAGITHGTVIGHVPPRPFLVPALEENRAKAEDLILQQLKIEVQKAFAKL